MKKSAFVVLLCFLSLFAPARNLAAQMPSEQDFDNSSRRILEQANEAFDSKDFGTAFRLAETAKERWKTEKERSVAVLEAALSQPALMKAGDNLETVSALLRERNNIDAVRIIESKLVRFGFQDFDYSVKNFTEYIKNTAYPEADFLLGKLYMIEGEYALAAHFYASAYEGRRYLDIPDVQFDILADLAELYKLTGDSEKYESVLLILASQDDKYRQNNNPSAFISAVVSAVKRGMGADKLFFLYRSDNYKTLPVWYRLTTYYDSLDLNERAFETALLFCITAVSRADSIIKSRDMDYAYTGVRALLHKIQLYGDINEWAAKYKLWEGFYLLGKTAHDAGYASFAAEIFAAVAAESPERTWNVLAQKALSSNSAGSD